MSISYAICVCNEALELKKLLNTILPDIRTVDEIVILVDVMHSCSEVYEVLREFSSNVSVFEEHFNSKDFASWKNLLNSKCKGDYIFQIDADEYPNEKFLKVLPKILESNNVDILAVPRRNTVQGLTSEDIQRWKWNVSKDGVVNWPDYQWRIYKNSPKIRWQGRVHEVPVGFRTHSMLPENYGLYLIHDKCIEKQRKQNNLYDLMQNE